MNTPREPVADRASARRLRIFLAAVAVIAMALVIVAAVAG